MTMWELIKLKEVVSLITWKLGDLANIYLYINKNNRVLSVHCSELSICSYFIEAETSLI
jgi:hypothetical protein